MQKPNLPTLLTPNIAPHHDKVGQIMNRTFANRKKREEGTPKKGA